MILQDFCKFSKSFPHFIKISTTTTKSIITHKNYPLPKCVYAFLPNSQLPNKEYIHFAPKSQAHMTGHSRFM